MNEKHGAETEMRSLGMVRLTAFAIGTTLASGVFSLSGDFAANGAYPLATILGWLIAGVGMFFLCMCFHRLSVIRPELTSGIYTYADRGFGRFIGYSVAWGYWISAILASITFSTLLFAAVGYFLPAFGAGNNLLSILGASVVVWLFAALVMRGVNRAATLNVVIVIAKIVPILLMLVAVAFAGKFSGELFMENLRAGIGPDAMPLIEQIKATTYTTAWAFVGIESAVVISGRARTTVLAGRATALSFVCLAVLYIIISMMSMGVMSMEQLAALENPPLAGLVEYVVGPWGGVLVNIAVIISLVGALFTYTIFNADCAYAPAMQECFPKFFTKVNKHNAPVTSIIITTLITQLFLIIVYFNETTYQICYTLSTSVIMVPYLLSALYCWKLTAKGEGLEGASAGKKLWIWIIVVIGTLYGAWLLYSSGWTYMLISALMYGPGIFLFLYTRKQQGKKMFETKTDIIACIVLAIAFVLSIVLISMGILQPF